MPSCLAKQIGLQRISNGITAKGGPARLTHSSAADCPAIAAVDDDQACHRSSNGPGPSNLPTAAAAGVALNDAIPNHPGLRQGRHAAGQPEDAPCDADHPADLTDRGWLAVFGRLIRSLGRDGMWLRSAGVAYCGLFAAVPGAAVPVALVGLLIDPEAVHRPIEMLDGLVPGSVTAFLADQMKDVALASRAHVGTGLGGAALAALWGALSGASGLVEALNVAYREEEGRGFLHRKRAALLVVLVGGLFMLLALFLVALLPLLLDRWSPGTTLQAVVSLARWPALAALCTVVLAMLYRFAPCRRVAKWRWVLPGALAATALWLAATTGFSFYVSHFSSYRSTLGLLGTMLLLMTWFYLTAFSVLLGAELNAELERQTSRDTTAGPARHRGQRGATVADTTA
jgi:membrane protein